MKVTVHVPTSKRTIVVNVGKGGQTVRWLANVASERARRANQPHGTRRTRETNLKALGRYLPEGLTITVRSVTWSSCVIRAIADMNTNAG